VPLNREAATASECEHLCSCSWKISFQHYSEYRAERRPSGSPVRVLTVPPNVAETSTRLALNAPSGIALSDRSPLPGCGSGRLCQMPNSRSLTEARIPAVTQTEGMEKSSMFSMERFSPGAAHWSADFPLRFPGKNGGFDSRPKRGRRQPRTQPATPERRSYFSTVGCSRPLPQTIVADAVVDGPSPVVDLRTLAHRNTAPRLKVDAPWGTTLR